MSRRPSYAEPTLALFPDEEDVELPLGIDEDPQAPYVHDLNTAREVDAYVEKYRRALVEATDAYVDAIELGRTVPAERFRAWRRLSNLGAIVDPGTPEERRDDGIARAAAKWTEEEVAQVDAAIRAVVEKRSAYYGGPGTDGLRPAELTTADVWAQLGEGFPVTKGIAGRMLAAKGAGLIANTGRTIIAPKDATGPNHGQRLTVWRAL